MLVFPTPELRRTISLLLCACLLAVICPRHTSCAIPPEDAYWQLLKSRYDASSENYAAALSEEFAIFRSLYPHSAKSDSLEYLAATVYEHQKNEAAAIASFLKVSFVYPSSALIPQTEENLKRLAESKKRGITAIFSDDNLALLKRHVLKVLDEGQTFPGGERGYLDWIQLVADARIDRLSRYLINECRHYLYRLNYDFQPDRVCLIMGNMYRMEKKWRNALIAYRTAEVIEPYGDGVGEALLGAAEVYLRELENYEMARRVYLEVIDKFPAELIAGRASVLISEVDEAEENYSQAVVQLEDTAKRFPFVEIRTECYGRIGRIYLDYLNNTQKSLEFYERVVSEFPGETRAAEVLIKIGGIHEEKTKNYADAIRAYRRIAELFPDSPLAPRYLYQAGELAEDKIKDDELARSVYRQLAENYPLTDFGEKASKKLR